MKWGLELVSHPHFQYDFFLKKIFLLLYLLMTKFHCLIAFTLSDIGQYVYCNCFWRKIFILLYFINWPNFIIWLPLLYEYWAICLSQLLFNQVVTSWILKLTLSFLWSRFSYITKKSWQKLKYLENEKSFWDGIKSIFHHFKGLSMKQITETFLEGESPTLKVSCTFMSFYVKKLFYF